METLFCKKEKKKIFFNPFFFLTFKKGFLFLIITFLLNTSSLVAQMSNYYDEGAYREPFSSTQEQVFGNGEYFNSYSSDQSYKPFSGLQSNSQQRISFNGLGLLEEPAPVEDAWFLFIPFVIIFIVMRKIKSKKKNTATLLLLLVSLGSLQAASVTPKPPVDDKDFVLCYGHKIINIFANDGYDNIGADGFPEGVTPPAVTFNHETAALGTVNLTSRGLLDYTPNGNTGVDVITYTVGGNTAKIYLAVLKPFAADYYICANVPTTVGLYKIPGVASYQFRRGTNQINQTTRTTQGWGSILSHTTDTDTESVYLSGQTAEWEDGYYYEYKVDITLSAPYNNITIPYIFLLHRSKYCGGTDIEIDGRSGATMVGQDNYGKYGRDDDSFTGTILVNETFGGNNISDPEYNATALSFVDPYYSNYYVNTNPYNKSEPLTNAGGTNSAWKDLPRLVEGVYMVSKTGEPHWNPNQYFWNVRDDHTYKNDPTRGYFLEANAAEEGKANKTQFFVYNLQNLCTGTQLVFSAWMAELNIPSILSLYSAVQSPNMTFTMALGPEADAPVIATYETGSFPRTSNDWRHYGFKFNVPENIDHLTLKIVNNSVQSWGNDFALDDIQVLVSRPQATAQYENCSGIITGDYNGGTDSYNERRFYAWIYNEFTDNVDDSRWEVVGGNTGIKNTSERAIHDVLSDPVPGYYYRFVVAGDFGNIRSASCRSASAVIQRPNTKIGEWVEDLKAVINPGTNVQITGKVKYIGIADRSNIPVTLYKDAQTSSTKISLTSDSQGNISTTLGTEWLDFKLIIGEIGDAGSGVDPTIAGCPSPRSYEYILERGNIKITPGKICSGEQDTIKISIANANDPNKTYRVDCFLNKDSLPLDAFRMEPFSGFVAPSNMTGSFVVGSTTVYTSYLVAPERKLVYTFTPNGVTGDIVLPLPIEITNAMALTLKNSADLYEKPKGAADNEYQNVSTTDVTLYVGPRETWWVGKSDGNKNDWNDAKNWSHGIPMKCTYVHIPGRLEQVPDSVRPNMTDGLKHFPELKNYHYISNNFLCDTIHFHPGGEVAKTPYLDYEGAKVELEMKRDQWFMSAPPLRDMYFGDFWLEESFNRMQPTVYAMMYQTDNPEIKAYTAETGAWSYPFNTLKETYSPGKGAVIKIDTQGAENAVKDKKPGAYKDTYTFYFPKDSTEYQYYYKPSGRPAGIFDETPRTSYYYTEKDGYFPERYNEANGGRLRTRRHRFIYEDELTFRYAEPINKIGTSYQFEILVLDNLGEIASTVLLANPFMSHLDFNLFYSLNSTKIKNTFKMVNGNGSTDTYITEGDQYFTTFHDGNTTTNSLIPPMQSFIVEKGSEFEKFNGDELQLNTNMSVLNPAGTGYILKSARQEEPEIVNVEILNKDGNREGAISLFYDEFGTHPVQSEAFFTTTISSDGKSMITPAPFLFAGFDNKAYSIHSFTGDKNYIPLGIRYDFTGTFSLKLNKISDMIGEKFDIKLVDSQTGLSRNLKENPVYQFENTTKDVYGRFFLEISKIGSGIKDISAANDNIFVYEKDGMIEVRSEHSNPIYRVDIYSLQGQLLFSKSGVEISELSLKRPHTSGITIIKITTKLGEKVQKIVLK